MIAKKYFLKVSLCLVLTLFMAGNLLALDLESEAFKSGGYIPDRYSCDAQDFSPSLSWADAPAATKSFALICDDPDAPFKIWVHWVIFNIPAETNNLKENITEEELSSLGAVEGSNDFGTLGYRGPCPPEGKPHRYFFKLYALDTTLELEQGATKSELIEAMQSHIVAETKIVASYQR